MKYIKKGLVILLITATFLTPVQQIFAEKEEKTFSFQFDERKEKKELAFGKQTSGKVFVKVEGEYLQILEEPREDAEWNGKVFSDTTVEIIEQEGDWTKIATGNLTGYTKTENLIIGRDAIVKAQELLGQAHPDKSVLTLTQEEREAVFSVGETREEEEARLAAEEAKRIAEEQARIAAEKVAAEEAKREMGRQVVAYAKKFLGNPYVYGGTSLTRGTDCSGYVQGVYAHFGVSLPRTSYGMRKVGYKVSLRNIQPGDIVCFPGHVGIYAGNGKVINAINESKGIGYSDVGARRIITIRRIY